MVKRRVRVYIEGGSTGRTADQDFRKGWKVFLRELHDLARENGFQSLEVIRGLGRGNAFRLFKAHPMKYPDDLCVLLVDSETQVGPGVRVWDVVANREGDRWQKPSWANDSHLYLMVVFVETWLLTDQNALLQFFKDDFDPRHLPTTDLENRSKDTVNHALDRATRNCRKGPYRHGQAHEIIEFVQPERVRTLSHGFRLFDGLSQLIRSESQR